MSAPENSTPETPHFDMQDTAFTHFSAHYHDWEMSLVEDNGHALIPVPENWKTAPNAPDMLSLTRDALATPFGKSVRKGDQSSVKVLWFDAGLLGAEGRGKLTLETKEKLQKEADLLVEGARDGLGIEPLEARFYIPSDAVRAKLGHHAGAALVLASTTDQDEKLDAFLDRLEQDREEAREGAPPQSMKEWMSRWQATGHTTEHYGPMTDDQADIVLADLIAQKCGKISTARTDLEGVTRFRERIPGATIEARRGFTLPPIDHEDRDFSVDDTTGLVLWLKHDAPLARYHDKYNHPSPELKAIAGALRSRFHMEIDVTPIELPYEHGIPSYGLLLRADEHMQHVLLETVRKELQDYTKLSANIRNEENDFYPPSYVPGRR